MLWDRRKKKADVIVQCPRMDCRAQVVVSLGADRVKCKTCGNEWALKDTALLRGRRGSV